MKPRIKYPIIVEGKYDKIKLDSIFDANVITTGGFAIFTGEEKIHLIKRLAEKSKIIILTDSDGAGHLIRSHIKCAVSPDRIINLYVPEIFGKEKRKREYSKEGKLGVEGIEAKKLTEILSPYFDTAEERAVGGITKADLYELGLSGGAGSAQRRQRLLKDLQLPQQLSPNALLDVLNCITDLESLKALAISWEDEYEA